MRKLNEGAHISYDGGGCLLSQTLSLTFNEWESLRRPALPVKGVLLKRFQSCPAPQIPTKYLPALILFPKYPNLSSAHGEHIHMVNT